MRPFLYSVLWCVLGVVVHFLFSSTASPSLTFAQPQAEAPVEKFSRASATENGEAAFQRGSFEEAIRAWQSAIRSYQQIGNRDAQHAVLLRLSAAYMSLGQYTQALDRLNSVLANSPAPTSRRQQAEFLSQRGTVYLMVGALEAALPDLESSLSIARELNQADLVVACLNTLGNLYARQEQYDRALVVYQEAIQLADQTRTVELSVRVRTNQAKTLMLGGRYRESEKMLHAALTGMQGLAHSHDKAFGLVTIGRLSHSLSHNLPKMRNVLFLQAFNAFQGAIQVADAIGHLRVASYAWGYLGTLYEEDARYVESLQVTRRAVFIAQQAQAPESLYRWQWQVGRLLKAQQQYDTAIEAYQRAILTVETIRQGIGREFERNRLSFRQSLGRVYFQLVDLLLQRAARAQGREQRQQDLLEARRVIELLKAAELRDYFQDDCVDVARRRTRTIEEILGQATAVLYPIPLPDRLELLVSLPTGLKNIIVPVTEQHLRQEVRAFRQKIVKRTTRQYLSHAQQLYDWLVRPLESDLQALRITTLVFVPDGPLRTIPLAALHDGSQFVIDSYAIATTPGIEMTDPQPLSPQQTKLLAAGLSEAVQGFPALPHVEAELQAVGRLYESALLLNKDFRTINVATHLQEETFNIVHIASHGQFANDAEKTFILTFDEKLTLNQLDQLIGLSEFSERPLDLLTLSACETAAGDERAALGLAGVAIKAGAQSAIATLWRVSDEAAALLVAEFYHQLQSNAVSRAVALQRAQAKLLADDRYQHPGYWSPFLLLNNWL